MYKFKYINSLTIDKKKQWITAFILDFCSCKCGKEGKTIK